MILPMRATREQIISQYGSIDLSLETVRKGIYRYSYNDGKISISANAGKALEDTTVKAFIEAGENFSIIKQEISGFLYIQTR